jgi:hypothetical protein
MAAVPNVHRQGNVQYEYTAVRMNKFATPLLLCQRSKQFNPTPMKAVQQD